MGVIWMLGSDSHSGQHMQPRGHVLRQPQALLAALFLPSLHVMGLILARESEVSDHHSALCCQCNSAQIELCESMSDSLPFLDHFSWPSLNQTL